MYSSLTQIATVEIDWEADREAEDVPGLLRELGKKLKTDTDESEKVKLSFESANIAS